MDRFKKNKNKKITRNEAIKFGLSPTFIHIHWVLSGVSERGINMEIKNK